MNLTLTGHGLTPQEAERELRGLGFTDGLTFHVGGVTITLTSLAVAAIAGIVLNAILPGNDFHFGKSESGDDVASLGRY